MTGELARRSVGKHCNTVRLLIYHSPICYVSNSNALFKAYRCLSCDHLINKVGNLERDWITCPERVEQFFPKNFYQLRETPFDKLESFNIPYSNDQKLFRNMAFLDFESISVQEDKLYDNDTTYWIGKHI